MSTIIRIQGEAPPLFWTPEIDSALPAITAARLREHECYGSGRDREWWEGFSAKRLAAGGVFAAAQGWTAIPHQPGYMPSSFGVSQKEWNRWRRQSEHRRGRQVLSGPTSDHAEAYRLGGHVVALVFHEYGKLLDAPIPEHLVIDVLPESWYWPSVTTAYCIRPSIVRRDPSRASTPSTVRRRFFPQAGSEIHVR
jgi:hypothetical protein